MKTHGWELLLLVCLVLQKFPQGLYLLNNFLLSLYISSIVNSPQHLLIGLFFFILSFRLFLPTLYWNCLYWQFHSSRIVLYETLLKKELSLPVALGQRGNC